MEPTAPAFQPLSTAPATELPVEPVEQAAESQAQSSPAEGDAEWPRRKRELDALLASLDGG